MSMKEMGTSLFLDQPGPYEQQMTALETNILGPKLSEEVNGLEEANVSSEPMIPETAISETTLDTR